MRWHDFSDYRQGGEEVLLVPLLMPRRAPRSLSEPFGISSECDPASWAIRLPVAQESLYSTKKDSPRSQGSAEQWRAFQNGVEYQEGLPFARSRDEAAA